jgi:hypothetical protein
MIEALLSIRKEHYFSTIVKKVELAVIYDSMKEK